MVVYFRWTKDWCKWFFDKFQLWSFQNCVHYNGILFQRCSDLLWEKIVLVIEKNFWNLRLKAKNLQNFWDHLNNLFKLWKVRTISGKGSFTNYVYKRRGVGGPKKSWTFYWFWFLPEEKPLLSCVSLFQKLVQNMYLWTPQMNKNINQVYVMLNVPWSWSNNLCLSVHTCNSRLSSGTTRYVLQPLNFLDLSTSPKIWSPAYNTSLPLAPINFDNTSHDPVK